jgi:predicted transcriptional regulator of viral defense system
MNFDALVSLVGELEWFDLATLTQLTSERRATISNQLFRLAKAGRILALRRGMYALAPRYRRVPLQPAALANALYRPSYLSELWALSFHGLIPESVPVYTSVTARLPKRFQNDVGEFAYRNVKQELFFGYRPVQLSGRSVLIATPEKALFDFFHLSRGEWTSARMQEMRFSSAAGVGPKRLGALAEHVGSPRLRRAAALWANAVHEARKGEVEL